LGEEGWGTHKLWKAPNFAVSGEGGGGLELGKIATSPGVATQKELGPGTVLSGVGSLSPGKKEKKSKTSSPAGNTWGYTK